MKERRKVGKLIKELKHQDWKIRSSAAEALGAIGDARAVEPLTQVLNDKDEDVRLIAAHANLDETLREAFRLGEYNDASTRKKAMAKYRKYLWKDADCHVAWFNLGVIQSRNGKWQDAISSFSRAQESPQLRTLAAFAKLKLRVTNNEQVPDSDLPEEFRGENRGSLGVQGP